MDVSVTEDEVHFLFRCPTYSMVRNNFYNKIKTLIPNITQLPVNVSINEPMDSSNYFINIQFIKYISASGADPGEVKWVNFHLPPFFLSPLLSFFSYPSNIEIIFDFSD